MKQVEFEQVPRHGWFLDRHYSGEWMRKVDDCTARWEKTGCWA
jgi:hypothetical protein